VTLRHRNPKHLSPARAHRTRAGLVLLVASLLALTVGAPPAGAGSATSVVDFSQCANEAPPSSDTGCARGWINGALQKSNSHYAEDQVVPQRVVASVSGGGKHTFVMSWQDRKGSANAHAYDSLATWNATQASADACQGLSGSTCPARNGAVASTTAIPLDPTPVAPCAPTGCSTATSAHQLTGQVLTLFGGTLVAFTGNPYKHSAAGTLGTDDYTTLTVTYTTAGAGTVELLYGGHLAPTSGPRGWGAPYGSGNISGGPYHFKLQSLDGASAGSRDNQIQASAILGPPAFTITKTASPSPAVPGQIVTYTITVTNAGNTAGATTFVDANDSRVTNLRLASTSPTGGTCLLEPGSTTLDCTTSAIDPGKTQVFTITAVLPATLTGAPGGGSCGGGQYPVLDTATLANGQQAQATVCVSATPSFTVTKTASPTTTTPGGSVTYTITVTNGGSAPGSTTFVDDNDARVTAVSLTGTTPTGGGCTPVSGSTDLSCTTSSLDPGASQVFTVTATMPTAFTGTSAAGCATGQYPVVDTVTLANGTKAQATVCVDAAPAFTVTKSASPTTSTPGKAVRYTITVTNAGSAPGSTTFLDDNDPGVTAVSLTATSPTGGTCSAVAGTTDLSCSTGSIDPGRSQVFTVSVTLPPSFSGTPAAGCPSGQYPVVDAVTLANGQQAKATVCVDATPAFTVSKAASPTSAAPGGLVTYTITVTNGGAASGTTSFLEDNDPRVTSVTFTGSSPTGGTCSPVTGTTDLSCATSTIDPGKSQVFTVTAKMPVTFTGTAGGGGCTAAQYPVVDAVTLTGGTSAKATVCVNAAPALTVSKSASPTTSTPGGAVTWTITVTNGGSASGSTTFVDDNDPGVTGVALTGTSPAGGTCTALPGTTDLSCTTGVIDPGQSQVFTVTAALPTAYSGTSGTGGCASSRFPVVDTVTLENGKQAQATVCVSAAPHLVLRKSAGSTAVRTGDAITYALAYSNNGSAQAAGTTIGETVPAGTQYAGCTGGCTTSGSPVSSVTWSLGTVPAGGSGSVTLTVTVTSFTACAVTNTATISSPDAGSTPTGSNTVTVGVTPTPDLAGAKASGSALGANLKAVGLNLVTLPQPSISSTQTGVGSSSASSELLGLTSSQRGGLLAADVLDTSSTGAVTTTPAEARDTSAAETAKVCVLPGTSGCVVSADVVLAVAQAQASGTGSSVSTAGSTFTNLKVNGVAYNDVPPNTKITLLGGTVVVLDEQVASTSRPAAGQGSGGRYAADVTVTMIHVTTLLGTDVAVARAVAHAEFPQLTLCGSPATASVSGNALVAGEDTVPSLVPVLVGYVEIPPSGGAQSQQLATFALPTDATALSGSAANSSTSGSLSPTPAAQSLADVTQGVCLLPAATRISTANPRGCLVRADLVRSQVSSSALGAAASSSDAGTQLTNVVVDGLPAVAGTPAPNTVLLLPGGLGAVVLNEHVCTGGSAYSATNPTCAGTTATGLTVTALHVVLVVGTLAGVEVRVAQAHSDAQLG
jgi:uncharacterized repeat protein (TIGR01451 family)